MEVADVKDVKVGLSISWGFTGLGEVGFGGLWVFGVYGGVVEAEVVCPNR